MNIGNKVHAWHKIEDALRKVPDRVYRNAMRAELQARAEKDWGYCPATMTVKIEPELDEWEKTFIKQIQIATIFGVKPKGFGAETQKAIVEMYNFVRNGGTLSEIPPDIRTPFIVDLYNNVKKKEADDLMALVEYAINALKHP